MKKKKVSIEEARFMWDMGVVVYVMWRGTMSTLAPRSRGGMPPDCNEWWRSDKAPRFWVEVE